MLKRLNTEDLQAAPVTGNGTEYRIEPVLDETVWENMLAIHPLRSVYASWSWGEYKRGSGWQVERFRVADAKGHTRAIYHTQTRSRFGVKQVLIQGAPLFFECDNYGKISKVIEAIRAQIDVRWNVILAVNFYGFRSDETIMGLLASGFVPVLNRRNFTLVMDLSKGIDEVSRQLNQTARRYIRQGEKTPDLTSVIVSDPDERRAAVDRLSAMYDDMVERKNFDKGFDAAAFRHVVAADPRYVISEVRLAGEVVSTYIAHEAANRMTGLVAASSKSARESGASYVAIWRLFEYAVGRGLKSFDLSGIDPYGNYGTFQFKHRISRKLEQSDPLWLYAKNRIVRNAVAFALTKS